MGKGYNVKIFDSNVSLSKLLGKNKDYIFAKLPHINEILVEDLDHFLSSIELLVIVNKDKYIDRLLEKIIPDLTVIDFVGLDLSSHTVKNYDGICW